MRATARKVWPASLVAISLLGLSGVPASAQLFDPEYSGNLLASGACADCFLTADLAVNGPLSQYLSGPAPNEIQIDSYEVVNMTISDNGGQSASIATPSDQRNIWFVLYAFLNPAHTTIEFSRGWDLLVMWDGGKRPDLDRLRGDLLCRGMGDGGFRLFGGRRAFQQPRRPGNMGHQTGRNSRGFDLGDDGARACGPGRHAPTRAAQERCLTPPCR